MMLENYDLLGKYTSDPNVPFDKHELAQVYSMLGLEQDPAGFDERLSKVYKENICAAIRRQNKIMTELFGTYLHKRTEESEIDAYRYLLDNLDKIETPYMLDNLAGVVRA